jgi:adenosylcobinamide kinase/adenosylcobinamide-phosphate guanylyltransferase
MDVLLLGTGAASGWPNPWCECASCTWMRANGDVRGQTSALVDGTLLLDCGPEAPRAAERLGHSLVDVRHLLFTHAHPDHTGPAALMWRAWTGREDVVDVAGPPAVIEECRHWVAPDAPIAWHSLSAGDAVDLGGYRVRAVAAEHGDASIGPALLYDITGPDGRRIFWATDTAPLPPSTLDAVAGANFDAVFLEQTNGDDLDAGTDHLDLVSWPLQLAELRRRGAVTDTTQLVALHLGHGNPPPPRLQQRIAAWGAHVPADGERIIVGEATVGVRRRPQRVLVVGGARSGKSRWAESIVSDQPEVRYVATAQPRPDDAEWEQRVAEHKRRRPPSWQTVETDDVAKALDTEAAVLVECATLWLAGALDEPGLDAMVDAFVDAVSRSPGLVVVVSNEVGSGVVPATESGRRFRDELGRLNARLAQVCDEVWAVTAGIPQRLS